MDEKELKISFMDKLKLQIIKKQKDKLVEKYGESIVNDYINGNIKALPEPKKDEKDDFMKRYSLEKTEEEIKQDNSNSFVSQASYCQINKKTYKLPFEFTVWLLEQKDKNNDLEFVKDAKNGRDHFIMFEKMNLEEKYEMYGKIIEITLHTMENVIQMIDQKPNLTQQEIERQNLKKELLNKLIVESNFNNFFTTQRHDEGQLDQAVESQENVTRSALEFYTSVMNENKRDINENKKSDIEDRMI